MTDPKTPTTADPATPTSAPSVPASAGLASAQNNVNLTVIQADGSTAAPTARQQQLLQAARQAIESDPHFAALSGATLSRAEVNVGLDETQRGYLYLRYDVPGATPQEFWVHQGQAPSVKWKSGQVSVPLAAAPESPAG